MLRKNPEHFPRSDPLCCRNPVFALRGSVADIRRRVQPHLLGLSGMGDSTPKFHPIDTVGAHASPKGLNFHPPPARPADRFHIVASY